MGENGPEDLKSKVYVKESPIHGKGCYALRSIKKGEYIGDYLGPKTSKDGTYVLWILQEDETYRGINGKNELRFLNHSQKNNAEFEENHLYAVKRIKKDDEIFIDYGEEWADVP